MCVQLSLSSGIPELHAELLSVLFDFLTRAVFLCSSSTVFPVDMNETSVWTQIMRKDKYHHSYQVFTCKIFQM